MLGIDSGWSDMAWQTKPPRWDIGPIWHLVWWDVWSGLTFGQMYLPKWFQWNAQKIFLKYIKLSNPKNSNKPILSDWEPSEIYISISFLYKCENLEAYISLNIDMFYIYLSRNAWNRLWVKWHGMADEPPGSDFGLGWHFVRWLVGWPFAAG